MNVCMTIVYLSNKVREAVIMIILSSLNVVIRHAWLYEYYECLIDFKKGLLHHKITTFISQIFMAFLTFCLFYIIIIIIFILEKEKVKYFWVYMSQGFFQHWIKNNMFLSHNSDFFQAIASLYLTNLTFSLRIHVYSEFISCTSIFLVFFLEFWELS